MTLGANRGRTTVIGAGLMGHGIAQVLAVGGMDVTVHDPFKETLDSVPARVTANLEKLGLPTDVAQRIKLDSDLEASVAEADWVFEAAPERLDLKQEIFERIDSAAPAEAVLATNTSVMLVGEVAAKVQRPERVVGTHWWNPPFLVPLVEVVEAEHTDPLVVNRTIELLEALGKAPVHVKRDVAGFVGNRLQHALWREAFNLIDSGVCDAATVDTVVTKGFGIRLPVLGPVANADLVGLDLTLAIHEYVLPRLGQPSDPSEGLAERVENGDLGMSTGKGFLEWEECEADAARAQLFDYLVKATSTSKTNGEHKA
ncbi:MAG: 3-hydroxyacyl-CoA dehydrogenase family protein [Actinomycetes bacterium]